MSKCFTDLNNTVTEIMNNAEGSSEAQAREGKAHFLLGFEISWKVDEAGRCVKTLPDDTSSTERSYALAVPT